MGKLQGGEFVFRAIAVPGVPDYQSQHETGRHEGWCRGSGTMGIYPARPELIVPFQGQWGEPNSYGRRAIMKVIGYVRVSTNEQAERGEPGRAKTSDSGVLQSKRLDLRRDPRR